MENERNKKIEDILGSLDTASRASAPDFFYTRLKARMERLSDTGKRQSWAFRPVYALAALMLILVINAAVIWKGGNTSTDTESAVITEPEAAQSLAAEYSLNDANMNYDLNQDNK
jgi:hypothetical protein